MPTLGRTFFAMLAAGFGVVAAVQAAAAPRANLVLGQPNFTTGAPEGGAGSPGIPLTLTTLNGPGGVAVSPLTGKIFIADYFDAWVTRYPNPVSLANGAPAEDAAGPFTNGGSWSVYVDRFDSLWIADNGLGKILRYDNASTIVLNTANPNAVLNAPGCEYLFVDAKGTLWVTYGKSSPYVTWLVNARSLSSPSIITPTWTGGLKFKKKAELGGIAVAASGSKVTLWVADAKNNKVYRFDNPRHLQSEANAAAVLGQPKLTSSGAKTGAAGLGSPRSLFLDPKGALWVSDDLNFRAMRWDKAAKLKTGAPANAVLGQSSFTAKRHGVTAKLLNSYRGGMCTDLSGALWFADDFNCRVLRFRKIPKLQ